MEMWKYLANELKENTKCFVVVPRVEESESDNKLNSTESVLKVIQKSLIVLSFSVMLKQNHNINKKVNIY